MRKSTAGLYWGDLGFRLSYGQYNYHTFLETDTTFYFHDKLKSDYALFGIDYNFQISFWFDVELYLDNQYYIPSAIDDYKIDDGYARRGGGKLAFGYRDMYFRIGYENTYRNIKMIHNFYSLKNEMNTKLQSNQFTATISYQF